MIVIADTTPLNYLVLIDRVDLLPQSSREKPTVTESNDRGYPLTD